MDFRIDVSHLRVGKNFDLWNWKITGVQFHRVANLLEEIAKTPVADLGSFDLAWPFFGFSAGYIWFIGISQILGGGLLLFNKTKLIGVAILIPIVLDIIVVDFFFEILTGAMLSAFVFWNVFLYSLLQQKTACRSCEEDTRNQKDFQNKKKNVDWV